MTVIGRSLRANCSFLIRTHTHTHNEVALGDVINRNSGTDGKEEENKFCDNMNI